MCTRVCMHAHAHTHTHTHTHYTHTHTLAYRCTYIHPLHTHADLPTLKASSGGRGGGVVVVVSTKKISARSGAGLVS